jgi:IS5 family transposase
MVAMTLTPSMLAFLHRALKSRRTCEASSGVPTLVVNTRPLSCHSGPAARRASEHHRGFRKLVKWRTGCEGRIAYLKRRYGWDRTRMDGRHRTAIWCGHGIFAHNLAKIATLAS